MAYEYYGTITIHHEKVPGDLTDFPFLFNSILADLKTVVNGGKIENTASGGKSGSLTVPADLVFSPNQDGSAKYDFEVEEYDPATGELVAHIRIPSVSSSVDTVLYLVYGDSGVTASQESISAVWDASFRGVWHCNLTGTILDSTSFNNHGAEAGSSVEGKVADARGLTGESSGTVNSGMKPDEQVTFDLWIKPSQLVSGNVYTLVSKAGAITSLYFRIRENGENNWRLEWTIYVSYQWGTYYSNTNLEVDTWYHVGVTWHASGVLGFYLDGALDGSQGTIDGSLANPATLYLGGGFQGIIDEVRFSTVVRSAAYFLATFNNHSDPATFYSIELSYVAEGGAAYLLMEFSAEVWTNVWDDVHAMTPVIVRRGIGNPMERIADIGSLTFKLLNDDNKYSPDHASGRSGFEIGTGVRLRREYDGVTYDLFRGSIVYIQPVPGSSRERKTAVVCYDDMDKLARRKLDKLVLQVSQRSDQIVSAVVNNVYTPIGESYATGADTYAFAGDTWRDEQTTGRQALRDVVKSERGALWIAGDGTVTFVDRQNRPKKGAADTTITTGWRDMEVGRARENIANIIEVSVTPRELGSAGSVMWTLESTPSIGPGQSETYKARYTDPAQEAARVGGQSMIAPVVTTDYTMNSQADGGGDDLSADFTVTATFGANAADVLVTNDGAVTGYITKLQIRGTPLLTYQTILLRAEDSTSQDDYGPMELSLDMPIQDDPAVGRDFCDYLLSQSKDPLTRVNKVSLIANRSDAFMAAALAREVNDKLAITEGETGLDAAEFFIESVEHHILYGGRFHQTAWGLSPASRYQMWVLGTAGKSELGQTTYLGY